MLFLLSFFNSKAQVSNEPETEKSAGKVDKTLLPVYDLDSNKYTVIKMGSRFWLKENLRNSKYNEFTPWQIWLFLLLRKRNSPLINQINSYAIIIPALPFHSLYIGRAER